VRAIIWAFISILVAGMAVYGLDISSRHSAWQGVSAKLEIPPSLVDNDSEGRDRTAPFRDARQD